MLTQQRVAEAADLRDRAIVEFFPQTGIRLSEAATLTTNDVGLPHAQALPAAGTLGLRGNGRKERTVTLNSRACKALSVYLATRAGTEKGAALFASRSGPSRTT